MNHLYFGDCLDILKDLRAKHPAGFIDLIYIDPPFNSKRNYNILFEDVNLSDVKAQKEAFADTWSNISYLDTLAEIKEVDLDLFRLLDALNDVKISKSAIAYLTTMAIRIWYMHKVLKDTGSFYLHCDPKMSHYLKIICDLIFEEKNFRNEVIWDYSFRLMDLPNFYNRKHDVILFYAKSKRSLFYMPKTEWTREEIVRIRKQEIHKDENGNEWIWMPGGKGNSKNKKKFLSEIIAEGKAISDVWQMPVISSSAKERLGYPTQKPEELLERIIKASSNEGDLVADFFCGCGTTVAVSQRLSRQWLGVDISHLAIRLIMKRLKDTHADDYQKIIADIDISGFPKDIASARELAHTERGRIKFQDWVVEVLIGGVSNPKKSGEGGEDGHFTFNIGHNKTGVGIVEVKSGGVPISYLRSFITSVKQKKADMGIFVCFVDGITNGMRREAKGEGTLPNFSSVDKIQILSVEELMGGKEVRLPALSNFRHFKSAAKNTDANSNENGQLF